MEISVKAGEVYRHFKGNRYEVIAIATDCEDGSLQVVYKALYPPYTIYVRPYFQFIEELDPACYPSAKQHFRFEKETGTSSVIGSRSFYQSAPVPKEESRDRVLEDKASVRREEAESSGMEGIDPGLLEFLNGRTFEDQIRTLKEIKGHITDEMFAVMFVSLDFPEPNGSAEEKYQVLLKRLETMNEFDGKRFRE